jgi:PEP-CTERM motif
MRRLIAWLVLFFCALWAVGAEADPATLHIGTGAGTACAQGCGGDPNVIGSSVLSIFQNSGGAPDLLSPLALILGIPNYNGAAPTIASVTEYDPYAGVATGGSPVASFGAGLNAYGVSDADGFVNQWTSSNVQVYQFLGFEPPNTNASNNATNWFGVAPAGTTFYGLYVYHIDATLGDKGLFDVAWAGSGLPEGAIAIAYGCSGPLAANGHCANSSDVYTTPFTEAGRVTTPEPSSTLLLGLCLFVLGVVIGWRRLAGVVSQN